MVNRLRLRLLRSSPHSYAAELRNNQIPKTRERMLIIALGFLTSLLLFVLLVASPSLEWKLTSSFYDSHMGLLDKAANAASPVIIDIDEQSLRRYGQWPWPRNLITELLQKINRQNPAAVGIDALFSEPDRTSPVAVQHQLLNQFGAHLSLEGVPEDQRDYDQLLGRTLASGPFVLSYFFDFENTIGKDCLPPSVNIAMLAKASQKNPNQALYQPSGLRCSIHPLSESARAMGFINGRPDNDGIYRRVPLVIRHNERIYPNLALQTLSTALAVEQLVLESTDDGFILKLQDRKIPLDQSGNLLLRFPGPKQAYQHIAASDVLSGNVDPAIIENRIVFLGISAIGLNDYRPTPQDPLFTGVDFHATIVDNILHGDFLWYPNAARITELASIILIGTLFSILMAWSGPLAIILFTVLSMAGLLAISNNLFTQSGIVLSPYPAILTISSIVIATAIFKYWREQHRTHEIVQQVLLSQEATIEGFGAMAEYRDPETGGHIKRTQNYVKTLALALKNHPRFRTALDDITIDLMHKTAPLHDIGKIGIPDEILLKAGRLTKDEFGIMKQHTQLGADVIEIISAKVGQTEFLRIAKEIILCHQEKWDGSGYPKQLAREQIPVSARLMAVADVYDALISRRVYKAPYSHKTAVRMIVAEKDKHFDPDVVDAFLDVQDQFMEIALRFLDSEEQREMLLRGDDSAAV